MNDYTNTSDALARVIGQVKGISSGDHDDTKHLKVDQQLKVVEIQALLSIAQELSGIRQGMSPDETSNN